MTRTTTIEFTCDLCEQRWRTTSTVSHDLPDLRALGTVGPTATWNLGSPKDYCDECVKAVREARDQMIEERRKLKAKRA